MCKEEVYDVEGVREEEENEKRRSISKAVYEEDCGRDDEGEERRGREKKGKV